MRPVYLCDLDAVTRVLLGVPKPLRAKQAARIVQAADTADRYRKRFGRAHPEYGTGTLVSAVNGKPRARISSCDATYRACLSEILHALAHQSA